MTLSALNPKAVASVAPPAPEPISLLQLDGRDPVAMGSTVYRQVRQGRRVVVVVGGPARQLDALAERLDAIGLSVARPSRGDDAFDADVALAPGREDCPPARSTPLRTPKRVALAGLGVVGGGLLERLKADPGYVVVGALVRDAGRKRDIDVAEIPLFTDPAALLAREPDVVLDALSDSSTSLALIRASLSRGVDVVSASKQAVGQDLLGLERLAGTSGARLAYSACVGGGAPLVETVRRARRLGRIVEIEGVLNGTCNYVLNRLADGQDLHDALSDARAAGFAEADPSADLSGVDAAAKLAILAHEAGHRLTPSFVATAPLMPASLSYPARQIARFDLRSGVASIAVKPLNMDHPFAALRDERNAVRITLDDGRVLFAEGRGAGRIPTVESMLSDVADL